MYETFIDLNKRPFAAVPLVDGYYPGTVCENARTVLTRCIERGEGIGMLVGPVGTGKTLLCQKLAEQFQNTFQVVLLASGRLSTRRSLFQAILYELDQPYRSMDEGELRLALVDYLMLGKNQSRGLLLLVDEAHTLPLRLLDEMRMLTNLTRAGQPLVRVILSGNSALEERLTDPKLESFNSRIATRCYLEAFNRSETAEYLRTKIDLTGGNGEDVFSDDACLSVYQATEGVPRLINQLCDHALLVAFSDGRRRLEAAHIEEAWADLQQLPTPWNGDSQGDKPGVIEFGRLDDMPDEEDSSESIKMPTPSLRINAELDELDCEPAEQIDSITRLINGAETNYDPSPSIEPEIELSFDDFEHPFQELFEQEEIVSDRYASSSSTYSVMQSTVPVFQFETVDDSLIVRENVQIQEQQLHGSQEKVRIQEKMPDVQSQQLKNPPVTQETNYARSFGKTPVDEKFDSRQTRKTLPLRRNAALAIIEPKNETIEADSPVEEKQSIKPIRPIRPARRNEYSRLFAKLRQG